jgi:isopenicillin N synthase-like dioxygenase
MERNIPIVDLASLDLDEEVAILDSACREWGLFFLRGHDIGASRRRSIFEVTQRFFGQPTDIKNRIRRTRTNSWGYYDAELTKNRRDWKEILDIGPAVHEGPMADSTPQWPDVPAFRETIDALRVDFHGIALTLVATIERALEATEDLTAAFADHSSYIRLNYYPECSEPAPADSGFVPSNGHLGISHHTDAGAVTVLMQDEVTGLQVFKDGRFHTVAPPDDALIINIGDVAQVWSNDRYRAPLHRVLANSGAARISIPYFLNPGYGYDYSPVASTVDDDHPPRYRPINWGEFRAKRSAGDYADFGDEVQISDYALTEHPG